MAEGEPSINVTTVVSPHQQSRLAYLRGHGLHVGLLLGEERRQDTDRSLRECRVLGRIRWLQSRDRARRRGGPRDQGYWGHIRRYLVRWLAVELVLHSPGRDHGVVQCRVQNGRQPRLAVWTLLLGSGEREGEVMPALRGRHGVVVLDRRVGARRALFLELAQFGQFGFGLVGGLGWRRWHLDLSAGGEHPGLPLPDLRPTADDLAAGWECRDAEERQRQHNESYRVPLQRQHDRPPFLVREYNAHGPMQLRARSIPPRGRT